MQMTVSDHQPVQPHIPVDVALEEGCVQMASSPHPAITEHKTDGTAAGSDSANQPVQPPANGTGGGQSAGDEGEWTEDPRYPGCKFNIRFVGETDLDKVYEARMDDYFQRLSADIVRFMSNPVR